MTTLYGGPMPDDFTNGEDLSASDFNKVKNYWITDGEGELPEGPEILDGDVLFTLGASAGGSAGEAKISAITGSGRLTTDGDSTVIEWLSDGSVTVSDEGLVPKALIIGGGASGGSSGSNAGGGGAGGHLELTGVYLPAGTLTCVVGDGGAASSHAGGNATKHGNNGIASSVNGQYFSPGGGAGSTNTFVYNSTPSYSNNGSNGASGGGAAYAASGGTLTGGLAISGLGNAGGNALPAGAGAGGGAGAAGGNGVAAPGATGGAGKASTITGSSVTRAGGGGAYNAGAGGSGGGGAAGGTATAGTANTGSGGGAGSTTSGAGGSGIVVLRLLTANTAGMDTSGFTIVTAQMLAAAEKKRTLERKKEAKKQEVIRKNMELAGVTEGDEV